MKYNYCNKEREQYCNKEQEQEQEQVVFANQGLGTGDFSFTSELLYLMFQNTRGKRAEAEKNPFPFLSQ